MEHIIIQLLQATAWPMETPVPYSPFHICLMLSGISAAVLGARTAARNSRNSRAEKKRKTAAFSDSLLFLCGLLLALSEVYKQLFLYEIVDGGRYDWWYFPFQLCSVPMYLCLILPFLSSPRCRSFHLAVYTFLQDFGLLGGVMALLEPSGLMHPYWTLTLHGFLWHFMLIFVGLYCALSGRAGTKILDFFRIIPLFFICCAIATAVNVASHPYGNADMFYISPYYPNGQIVFHQIALEIGVTAGNLVYLTGVLAGGFLVHLLCRQLCLHGRDSW